MTSPVRYYLGIDDTDYGESIGTGALARELRLFLMRRVHYECEGATRHQLLVDDRIPYTSHNSSACLAFRSGANPGGIAEHARVFIRFLFHEGADPGLCLVAEAQMRQSIVAWGERAQRDVLLPQEAADIARDAGIHLESLGGSGQGIVGALAACGLRHSRHEGRFILLEGMRDLPGRVTVAELVRATAVEAVLDHAGQPLPPESLVLTQAWVRPFFHERRIVVQAFLTPDGFRIPAHKHRGDT